MALNLQWRLSKLERAVTPDTPHATYDLRLLPPEAVDFICQFVFRPPDDESVRENTPMITELLTGCEVEPIAGTSIIMPEFPKQLQEYWRHQRFVCEGSVLPRGNYDFSNLSYAKQADFQILCTQHGWEPNAEDVTIEPVLLWSDEQFSTLLEFLEMSVPKSERDLTHQASS